MADHLRISYAAGLTSILMMALTKRDTLAFG
jgi:hypothetical protein